MTDEEKAANVARNKTLYQLTDEEKAERKAILSSMIVQTIAATPLVDGLDINDLGDVMLGAWYAMLKNQLSHSKGAKLDTDEMLSLIVNMGGFVHEFSEDLVAAVKSLDT